MDPMESWKEFDQNPLTHSAAHHLVTILDLLTEFGYARVSDVAKHLEITRGSVSITLKRLKERGLVLEDRNKHLCLSEEGQQIARLVQAKKFVLKRALIELLGVNERQADVDTCKIEHLISTETAERASRVLAWLDRGCLTANAFRSEVAELAPAAAGASDAERLFDYYQQQKGGENPTPVTSGIGETE
jgi:DtxR family Mn-dependent transcriptional regulator